MTTHPTLARYLVRVRAAGSKAGTVRGILAAVRAGRYLDLPKSSPTWRDVRASRSHRFSLAERLSSRYRDDSALQGRLNAIPEDTADWPAWLADRASIESCAPGLIVPPAMLGVQVLAVDEIAAEALGVTVGRCGKNWAVNGCSRPSWHEHWDGETEWKNGRPRHYTRARNITHVRALACISGRSLLALLHDRHLRIAAPAGYRWSYDALGIRLQSITVPDDDLHINASILLRGAAEMVAELECSGVARRAESARVVATAEAERYAYICRADSIAAGNCTAGTDAWVAQHGLDPQRYYPVRAIRQVAAGNGRVALAISAAVRRHEAEMAAGVCSVMMS